MTDLPKPTDVERRVRLESLQRLALLDTKPERRFDRITDVARRVLDTPMAVIGLVDRERVWFKSRPGLELSQVPLEAAFCGYTIRSEAVLEVPDTGADSRFREGPLVTGGSAVRFYCGLPLVGLDDVPLGTLAVMDRRPRRLDSDELEALRGLAVWASHELCGGVRLRQAARRERYSTTRMKAVVDNVREGIVTVNIEGSIESFNPAAERIFGYRAAEIRGSNFMTLLDLESAGAMAGLAGALVSQTTGTGMTSGGELVGRRKDRSTFPLEMSISQMYIGERRMLTAIVRDITRRKEGEQRLKESEERYRDLFENATDPIQMVNPEGAIVYANRAWREALGYGKEELTKLQMGEVLHPDHRQRFDEIIERVLKGERVGEFEVSVVTREGEELCLEGNASGKVQDGVVVSVRTIFRDLTQRRRVEQMKRDFLAAVSHELRTPVTAVRGFLHLLVTGAAGELPERAREMVERAHKSTQRLVTLVNELLDLRKLESGRMEMELKPCPVTPLIERAVAENRGYADQYGVDLVVSGAGFGGKVQTDPLRLLQVLANLVSNAVKFSPEEGTVTLGVEGREGRVRISVSDDGPGIPRDFREKVFERFTQAEGQSERGRKGSGLGLAITKELVEKMNGRIWFESSSTEGTTFIFDLPEVP